MMFVSTGNQTQDINPTISQIGLRGAKNVNFFQFTTSSMKRIPSFSNLITFTRLM